MKRKSFLICLVSILVVQGNVWADGEAAATATNTLNSQQNQNMQGQGFALAQGGNAAAEGGDASSSSGSIAVSGGSESGASASISTITRSKQAEQKIQPLGNYPPYLPFWQHGGWGTMKAYFPNGASPDGVAAYQRIFNTDSPDDLEELKKVIESLPHKGVFEMMGGMLNSIGVIFGGPDNFHHGRGFEISNSLARKRRPENKPLLVFIDNEVNRPALEKLGYVYVGKVGVEGSDTSLHNWDIVYGAVIAETLQWDVDIILVSGGMKGVTVGSNTFFPGITGAHGQANYSVSLTGGHASGIVEGKGKAMASGEGYRHWPEAIERRKISQELVNKISVNGQENTATPTPTPAPTPTQNNHKKEIQAETALPVSNATKHPMDDQPGRGLRAW